MCLIHNIRLAVLPLLLMALASPSSNLSAVIVAAWLAMSPSLMPLG
jgi:hypothetical protein